ncbi:MAG: SIR2 family protein, partial [Thermoanaerobaculia bacterium]
MTRIYGFGAERIAPPAGATPQELEERNRQMLSRALNLGTLVAFCGSGCSAPLGYPNWREFTRLAVEATVTAAQPHVKAGDHNFARLEHIANGFKNKKQRDGDARHYLFYIGLCQRVGRTLPKEAAGFYEEFIRSRFGPRDESRALSNPYHALLKLPIQRFVTTNYDVEIERALTSERQIPYHEFGIGKGDTDQRRSFTQKREHYAELAGFAIPNVPGMANTVFHCHGRYDDITSIVATEDDYQRFYLVEDDASGGAFRDSIELLFSSNPILFIGYSLNDEDLLRPLRMFSAAKREDKYSRPLFALIPRDPEDTDQHDFLFERYGVHAIPFTPPTPTMQNPSDNANAWAFTLKSELERIKREWEESLREWQRKPVMRSVTVSVAPPVRYQHYAPEMPKEVLAPNRLERDLAELRKLLRDPKVRVIVITGSGGAGKSWRALRLLETRGKATRGKTGTFFWSSYYTDDWLTGIDRALCYLEKAMPRRPNSRSRRIERFAACLRRRKHLLVFDGFERLLAASPQPGVGVAQHQGVRALLEIAVKGDAKIIITTRLMPDVLKDYLDKKSPRVREFPVRKITAGDLESG